MAGLGTHLLTVSASAVPKILIFGQDPNKPSNTANDTLVMQVNQSFTMTVNITDFPDLYLYQMVLKYNQTMLNMTSLTFPSNNVFANQPSVTTTLTPFNQTPSSLIDINDQQGMAEGGQSLLGPVGLSVSNSMLFQANFTVAYNGETTIHVATINDTADLPPLPGVPWYTFTQDANQALMGGENDNFDLANATLVVIAGASVPPPVAYFTARGTTVSNSTYIILMYSAGSYAATTDVLCNLTTYFNGSTSYDKYGTITEYVWNFDDGNTTAVQATGSPTDALITHVFTNVGIYFVNLTLVAQSGPNATQISVPFVYPITVDLAVPLYNWMPFIYAVLIIIVAVIAIASTRSAVRRTRKRRLRQQKMRRPDASEQPPMGAATT